MAEKIVQTAGRDQLGKFAPMFAHLNDDVHESQRKVDRMDYLIRKAEKETV